jgi:acid phosphatase
MRRRLAVGCCGLGIIAGCSSGSTTVLHHGAGATPSPAPRLAVPASPTASPESHVFVIVMENHSYAQAMGGTYTASLARQFVAATNYHAVSHPSLPNYLAMTSGSTWRITDDAYHPLPPGGIGSQLTAAGMPWRAYMEGMTAGCFRSGYPYALKHRAWLGSPPICATTPTTAVSRPATNGSARRCRRSWPHQRGGTRGFF